LGYTVVVGKEKDLRAYRPNSAIASLAVGLAFPRPDFAGISSVIGFLPFSAIFDHNWPHDAPSP
jgi:hypothetical protein